MIEFFCKGCGCYVYRQVDNADGKAVEKCVFCLMWPDWHIDSVKAPPVQPKQEGEPHEQP